MSLWSRLVNVFRADRLTRELDEEMQWHIEEAIQQGREPGEVRKSFGPMLSRREESRDIRIIPWLDSLRADAVLGYRQLMKRKVTSAAAILSLALAIGACTSAFRLIDALLLRPLPVANPGQLYELVRVGDGLVDDKPSRFDSWPYPSFELMRDAAKGQAELLALSNSAATDLTFRSDSEMEKATVQYVSGGMFGSFGLRPSAGRLLTENDDLQPGAYPCAVLSWDYWRRRFGMDPGVVGRGFRMGDNMFQIVGVGPELFTGTETGTVTDIFIPTMMHPGVRRDDWTWMRTLARVHAGVALEPLRAQLDATSHAFEEERAKGFTGMSKESVERFLDQRVELEPAAAGASGLQEDYRVSLVAIGALVLLVLLIACANVANLMMAQAASRAREMALRVSIGAGRARLVQLVLVESAWLAILAAAIGALFASWSAPFVVSRINPPDHPVRLSLPADWRVLAFGIALTAGVTLLFGLAPALRASAIKPAAALKGGANAHVRGRLMHALIALQVAFCFLALFVAGLFAATFQRLSHRPLGFSTERLLTLDTVTQRAEAPVLWDQVAEHLRAVPGVESVAVSGWELISGRSWNGFVSVNGAPPGPVLAYYLNVSPGWIDVMKIHLAEGRDFLPTDTAPGEAIVNETFVKQFLPAGRPIGQSIAKGKDVYRVIGVAEDAPYKDIHERILPSVYVPFHSVDAKGDSRPVREATFIVRTSAQNPLALASTMRREVPGARAEFRVSNIRTQQELVLAQTVRERLLAMLGLFFAGVALLLVGVGLYGVLDYFVLQRRREIGIRAAIGAQAGHIARQATAGVFAMVLAGAVAGVASGMASARLIETVLYQVKATDPGALVLPPLAILITALVAAMPAVVRAIRIDPATILRSE